MSTSSITAKYEDSKVHIEVNGETVRSVSPIHMNTYKFTVDGKEYWFLYEEFVVRGTTYRHIYLFPLNEFKDNKIEL